MKIYQYKCTLSSDVIITSDAATQGQSESLDYIPGGKFLGIAAGRLYDEKDPQRTLDLFHNGTVKFGDALLVQNGNQFKKVPFSWYHQRGKGLSDSIFLHHKINPEDQANFIKSGIQLKQARTGYFSEISKSFIAIDQHFSLKSAHDTENRKSKDGQMFGYHSLKAGSEWSFTIKDESEIYADDLKKVVIGKHRIGRSRTAEFGLVDIAFIGEVIPTEPIPLKKEIVIYAQSNLCFYDENTGMSTAQPSAFQLTGSNNAEIQWHKSQVRTRNYKTWNRYRGNKDADRIIIERGSVFVVTLNEETNSAYLEKGIGSHKAEGFGEVLVNPSFLMADGFNLPFSLKKAGINHLESYPVETGEKDGELLICLKSIKNRNNFNYSIDAKVNSFIKDHKGDFSRISKSQWGTLRNYAKNAKDSGQFAQLMFDEEFGFLYKGQSEKEWRTKNCRVILQNRLKTLDAVSEYLPFVIKLSNLMAKTNKS